MKMKMKQIATIYKGSLEIGHISKQVVVPSSNPKSRHSCQYAATLSDSDYKGKSAMVDRLHNNSKISKVNWEFPTFYFQGLDEITECILAGNK
jgi:hypothetical protein